MEYILTKSDYEDIRILIAISESIWESYEALANLEIMGKKETIEYQKVMEKLRSSMIVEPTIYGRIGTSVPKLASIIGYLESIGNNSINKDRVETIVKRQNKDLVIERIMRNMDDSVSINDEVKQNLLLNKISLEDDESVQQFKEFLNKSADFMNQYMIVAQSMEEDKYACFLSILKKAIESPINKNIRDQLIIMKYRMTFVCGKVEEMMLKQNFNISPQVYLRTTCIGQMEKQYEFITTEILTKSSINVIKNQTAKLLSDYNDAVLSSNDKKVEAIVRLSMLRAGLLFLSPECVDRENEIFHDTIDSTQYLLKYPNNREIENMIVSAYRYYNSDRTIPIQVTFKKEK